MEKPLFNLSWCKTLWHWCYFWEFGIGSTNNPLIDTFLGSHHLSSWFCIDIVRLKFLDSIVNLNLESFWSKWIHHHAKIHHSWRRINICYTLQRQSSFLVWNNNLWTISIVSTDWSSFFTSFQGHASETQLSSNLSHSNEVVVFLSLCSSEEGKVQGKLSLFVYEWEKQK